MAQVTGKVQKIDERETQYGTMYNLVVKGSSYGAGKFKPKCDVGDYVSFEVETNGRFKNVGRNTLKVVDAPEEKEEEAPRSSGSRNYGSNNRDTYEDPKQVIISKQAARNSAIAAMNVLIALDAVPIAKSGKVGDRFDAASAIIDKLTEKYFNYSNGIEQEGSGSSSAAAAPADDVWEDE